MKKFTCALLTLLGILMIGMVFAAEEPLGLEWDDTNTLTDLTHFNIYVCDQPIPDVPVDEFGAALDPVTCPGTMKTYSFPYAQGTSSADIRHKLTSPQGSLHVRADVERANGIRAGLSNQVNHTYDYQAPRTITLRINIPVPQ